MSNLDDTPYTVEEVMEMLRQGSHDAVSQYNVAQRMAGLPELDTHRGRR